MIAIETKIIKLAAPVRGKLWKRRKGEALSRHCTGCTRDLTPCSFGAKSIEPFRRQARCRECMATSSSRSYSRNRTKIVKRSKTARGPVLLRNRMWLLERLAHETCADCAAHAPDIFEFDHRHAAKRGNVSNMIRQGLSIATIEAEIAKCDILCPNCHRIRTHADTNSYLHRYMAGIALPTPDDPIPIPSGKSVQVLRSREKARRRNRLDNIAYLEAHPCVDCGEDDLRVLEYDHVRGEKADVLCKMISGAVSRERIDAERAKCEVRCCNCHRRRSHNSRQAAVPDDPVPIAA